MTPILIVTNLFVRYRTRGRLSAVLSSEPAEIEAVAGVSFTLAAGETFALVGESGSGKTTIARAIAGLPQRRSGSIRFEGTELVGLSRRDFKPIRRQMALMFQDAVGSLNPRLTVRAILAEPYKVHNLPSAELEHSIAALLDKVGLAPDFLNRYPHQLSGGQARRVNLARALALDPKLIIADEPTAGLDVSVQGEILNLLNTIQERLGLTILIITHNLHVVRHIANRVAIIYLGRIVEQRATANLFSAPRHPYSAALLSSNPQVGRSSAPTRIVLRGEMPSLLRRPRGCEFHTRCPFAEERCRIEAPTLSGVGGEAVSCHYALNGGQLNDTGSVR
jgi:oligopeptide/dipeptide ABC transporter ATP-binding protein